MSQGQTDHSAPKPAIAGMLSATGLKHDASGTNAEASAAMRFGIWVKKDSATEKGYKLLAATSDKPLGVTGFHHTYDRLKELDETTGGVVPKVDIAIRQLGIVWMRVEGTIAYGDRAHVRAVSGAGGTVLGVGRAAAVSGETIDCSNLGFFVGADDGGTTPERFAPFFVIAFNDPSIATAEIADLGVTTAKLAADAVTGAKLADDAVDSEHIADGAIDPAHLATSAVETAKIAAAAVTAAKIPFFKSTEQTGTGSSQDIAHGLVTTPGLAWFTFSELAADLAAGADIAEGAHDGTNLKVTVTSGIKFIAYAIK